MALTKTRLNRKTQLEIIGIDLNFRCNWFLFYFAEDACYWFSFFRTLSDTFGNRIRSEKRIFRSSPPALVLPISIQMMAIHSPTTHCMPSRSYPWHFSSELAMLQFHCSVSNKFNNKSEHLVLKTVSSGIFAWLIFYHRKRCSRVISILSHLLLSISQEEFLEKLCDAIGAVCAFSLSQIKIRRNAWNG